MKFYSLDFYDDDDVKTVLARGDKDDILKAWALNKKDYMDWLKAKMGLDQEEFRESMGLDHELTEEEIKENLFAGKDKDRPWAKLQLTEIEEEDIPKYKMTLFSDSSPEEVLIYGSKKDLLSYWRTNKEALTSWFLEYTQDNLPEGKKDPEVEAYEIAKNEDPQDMRQLRWVLEKIAHEFWLISVEEVQEKELYMLEGEDNPYILLIPINERENPKLLDSEDIERIKRDLNCSFVPDDLLEEVAMNSNYKMNSGGYDWKETSRIYVSSFLKDKCLAKLME